MVGCHPRLTEIPNLDNVKLKSSKLAGSVAVRCIYNLCANSGAHVSGERNSGAVRVNLKQRKIPIGVFPDG